MSSIALRPRSGTELLDAAFQFLRENFALLFTVVAGAFIPVIALELYAASDVANPFMALIAGLGRALLEPIALAGVILVVSERYMGRDITAGEALSRTFSRFLTIFATNFLYSLIVGIGLVLLIVPGLIWAAKYFAMMPAVVIEGYNSSTSQKRSSELTDGSKRRVFGLLAAAYIVFMILVAIVGGLAGAFFSSYTGVIALRLLMAAVYPFIGILVTLLYYDLRIRKEGLDMDILMERDAAAVRPATA